MVTNCTSKQKVNYKNGRHMSLIRFSGTNSLVSQLRGVPLPFIIASPLYVTV